MSADELVVSLLRREFDATEENYRASSPVPVKQAWAWTARGKRSTYCLASAGGQPTVFELPGKRTPTEACAVASSIAIMLSYLAGHQRLTLTVANQGVRKTLDPRESSTADIGMAVLLPLARAKLLLHDHFVGFDVRFVKAAEFPQDLLDAGARWTLDA